MHLSELCIKKPIGTCLVMLALLCFGCYGYYLLPINQLPEVYFPTIVVSAGLPGASPETMATSVATPLEKRFTNIAGVNTINSKSSLGLTQIILQFSFDKNIDAAALDVQSAIAASLGELPSNMKYPPVYTRINPAEAPVLYLSMYSDTIPLYTLNDYAEKLFGQRLSMLNGVSQVSVYGSQKYATRIQLNPNKLSAYQLPFLEVKQTITKANVNLPTGTLSDKQQELPIKINGQLEQIKHYQDLIIAFRNGAPVKLNQVGRILPSVENNKVASWFNDKRNIVLVIQRQPGSNTLKVIEKVYKEIEVLKKELPSNVNVVPMYDRSPSIRSSVEDVQHTLIISVILVVAVIVLFLRNLRASLIIGVVLPLSIMGTFAFMQFLGFSLNIISLLGLTLVVGFVVDDAIVVLENIMRHLEEGKDAKTSALCGVQEISFTVITMTLSLIIVFVPVLFMGGLIGKIFHEFAVTSVITILLSGVISLTFVPMLASKFLRIPEHLQNNFIFNFSEKINQTIFNLYKNTLNMALEYKKYILFVFVFTVLLSLTLFKFIAKSFIPDQDVGNLICFTEADPDIGFDAMITKQKQVADLIRTNDNIESVIYNVGAGGLTQTMNSGFIIIKLKPHAKRKHTADQIIPQLKSKVDTVSGIKVYLQNIQLIPISSKMGKGLYQYVILDPDLNRLKTTIKMLQSNFENIPELQDVSNDLQTITPQLLVKVDRDKANFLGVSMQDISNTLYTAFGTAEISNIYLNSENYKVILEILPEYNNRSFLKKLEIRSSNGNLIPLGAISELTVSNELLTINHQGQVPAATISFNLKPGKSLSEALASIENSVKNLSLPEGVVMQFSGVAETFKSSIKNLVILLLIVGLIIYILLGILYESFIHPLTVLSGLPAAFFGALFALYVFNIDLDLYGFIGLIILMGIVKKNAIMMIDCALEQQRNLNMSAQEAIYNACLIRFRPIMMTTLCAILSALPIALGIGSATIATQRSLGVGVVGGLVFSQILTLYITPVIYIYLSKFHQINNT